MERLPKSEYFTQRLAQAIKDGNTRKAEEIKTDLEEQAYLALASQRKVTVKKDATIDDIKSAITNNTSTSETDLEKEAEKIINNYQCNGSGLSTNGENYFKNFNSRNAAAVLALNMTNFNLYDVPDATIETSKDLLKNGIFAMILYICLFP